MTKLELTAEELELVQLYARLPMGGQAALAGLDHRK
jgi:hypothetical protein